MRFINFLLESSLSKIKSAVQEYIDLHSKDTALLKREIGADLRTLCHEPGNCSVVSDSLNGWLRERAPSWLQEHGIQRITQRSGANAKNLEWCKVAKVTPGGDEDAHTVTLINDDVVVDLTARQFDPKLPFPRIISYHQFRSEWGQVGP